MELRAKSYMLPNCRKKRVRRRDADGNAHKNEAGCKKGSVTEVNANTLSRPKEKVAREGKKKPDGGVSTNSGKRSDISSECRGRDRVLTQHKKA